MTSIEVGVRVRPFNSRELKFGCELIVAMPNTTTCEVRNGAGAPKKFNMDHCLWTFRPEGGADPKAADATAIPFADQLHVYQSIGTRILDNALQGFNACLFAYGQTGSGKTYTMMGTSSDPGIIPRLSQDLFQRERTASELSEPFTLSVDVTYLEIYNESVKDLLNAKGMDKALRVRQHPTFGVYVEGLSKWTVHSEAEVLKLLEDGSSVRSVAATKMNATSSRSHAILTLHIKKKTPNTELAAQLHLVDLAGSERASSTGAEGDTLMEGANINKSLTTLGMCLSRLAEVSSSGGKAGHVPFRDSQLTWLLNDSLGGNSKTAMLANISPASINAEETLSTLRFATTVKKIKNHAVVNEDPQQRLIRELRAEIEDIKLKIMALESGLDPEDAIAPGATDADAVAPQEAVDASPDDAAVEATGEEGAQEDAALEEGHERPAGEEAAELDQALAVEGSNALADEDGPNGPQEQPNALSSSPTTSAQGNEGTDADADADAAGSEHDGVPETHEALLERLEEDTTLMMQMIESNEEKLARTQAQNEENLAAMHGMKELQVGVRLTCPRLVTLNEDLHALPSVALLYYLREGDTWVGVSEADGDDDDREESLSATAKKEGAVIQLPSAACKASERFLPRHLYFHVDGLRQEVTLTVESEVASNRSSPASVEGSPASGSASRPPARVYVNGKQVDPGTSCKLNHLDRIVLGSMAYRHAQPVRWTNERLRDDFARDPTTMPHTIAMESHERLEHSLSEMRERRDMQRAWRLVNTSAGGDAAATALCDDDADLSEAYDALVNRVVASETHLTSLYPLTQDLIMQAALAADSAASVSCMQYDYDYAIQEVRNALDAQRRAREQLHMDTMEALKRQSNDRDNQIVMLREELQRQEIAKHALARSRLVASEGEGRDGIEGLLFDALKELVDEWRADRANTKRRIEERLRCEAEQRRTVLRGEVGGRDKVQHEEHQQRSELARVQAENLHNVKELIAATNAAAAQKAAEAVKAAEEPATLGPVTPSASAVEARNRRLSVRAAAPVSRHVDVMVQLAADVRQYEEACREATLWKPNGPTKAPDTTEYQFSLLPPTVQDVNSYICPGSLGLEGVLHVQDVHKLKRGFLGRLSYHTVHVLVRERFLYYFPNSDPSSKALGAAYLYGAAIECAEGGTIEGKKHTLRIVPSVPRKPTKSSRGSTEENNVLFAFDTADECEVMATLVRRLATPECPLSVKQFYANNKQ